MTPEEELIVDAAYWRGQFELAVERIKRPEEAIRWAIRQAEMPEPSLGLTQYTRYKEPILHREEFIAELRKRSGVE